jgi:hypothetical protein
VKRHDWTTLAICAVLALVTVRFAENAEQGPALPDIPGVREPLTWPTIRP